MSKEALGWQLLALGSITIGALIGGLGLSTKNMYLIVIGAGIVWVGLDILNWEE